MGKRDARARGRPAAGPEEAAGPEQRFRDLVEHASDLIVESDAYGRFLYVSPGSRDVLGYEPDELLQTDALDLLHPEDLPAAAAQFAELKRNGKAQALHRTQHRDGSWRWIQNTASVVRTRSGEFRMLAIGRDLTASKRLEMALERQAAVQERIAALSRRFLALEHDEIDEGIHEHLPITAELAGADRTTLIVIGEGRSPIGAFYYWELPGTPGPPPRHDPAIARDFRWSRQLLGRGKLIHVPALEAMPPEAEQERSDMLRRGVRSLLAIPVCTGSTVIGYQVFESVALQKEWTEQEITQLRLVGEIFASAIKRKQNETEIERRRAAEARVAVLSQRFLALGPDEIDEAIREALAQAAELAGADHSCLFAAPGRSGAQHSVYEWCADGIAPFSPTPMPSSLRRVLAGEIFQIQDPEQLPEEAAPERRVMQSRGVRSALAIPIRSGDETIGCLSFDCTREKRVWSEQDITLLRMIGDVFTAALRRKRAEEALRESRSQLLQAQKLEAVGRLAGGIAHDFNNLLTVILGFSRPLLSELDSGDLVREDIAEIHAAAERAAALTRQLLTFSRRQTLPSQTIDFNRTLAGLEQLLQRLLGEDIELAMELEADLGFVEIDPHQLEQVVMNIAVNARDAMPDGGSLRLRTERREIDALEARRLGLAKPGAYSMLSAIDSGCGIDEQTRAHVFDPFFTTKEPGKGTGLGLSIAYSVIEQAGGTIVVKGGPAKGTTFEIYLPRVDADVSVPDDARPAQTGTRSRCVLVAEDEPAVRRLMRRILEGHGHRVFEAEDGEEALRVAEDRLHEIDVLVSDVVMPKLGGGELAHRLRQRRPELPVLFTSGYPQERGVAGGSPLGADGFLQKPFTRDELLEKLRETLQR
jgi:PAS domain S-box-containing protein